MGGEEVPVKSTDVEGAGQGHGLVSKKLQNTSNSCALEKSIARYPPLEASWNDRQRAAFRNR
jgi:hypothetical protein